MTEAALRGLVDLARQSPSGNNRQPLKYMLSSDPTRNATIFRHLRWAASLTDWPGPAADERPSAYIVILADREIGPNPGVDHGIAAYTILLGATELGLGGCMLGNIDRKGLRRDLAIPERYDIPLVVAVGRPIERVVLEDVPASATTTYYRAPDGTHHVPKRDLDGIIIAG